MVLYRDARGLVEHFCLDVCLRSWLGLVHDDLLISHSLAFYLLYAVVDELSLEIGGCEWL